MNPFSSNLEIVSEENFRFIAERILSNFLFISRTAVATCVEPPYSKFPALITLPPVFTILPETPIISLMDFGFFLEYTKFV